MLPTVHLTSAETGPASRARRRIPVTPIARALAETVPARTTSPISTVRPTAASAETVIALRSVRPWPKIRTPARPTVASPCARAKTVGATDAWGPAGNAPRGMSARTLSAWNRPAFPIAFQKSAARMAVTGPVGFAMTDSTAPATVVLRASVCTRSIRCIASSTTPAFPRGLRIR